MTPTLSTWVPTIILIAGGVVVILQNRSTNKVSRSSDVISTLTTRVKQVEDENKNQKELNKNQFNTFSRQISDLNLEIGKCQGVIQEKNTIIEKLEKVIANRNPELITILEEIKQFMKDLHGKVSIIAVRTEVAEKRNEAVDQGHAVVAPK